MPDGRLRSGCVVILTAIPVEYQAVRAHLTDLRSEISTVGTLYERGRFKSHRYIWDVLIVETGAGIVRAATETARAIERFNPAIMLFIGVAGGLRDVKLGDVVVATKVYGYESGRSESTFHPRPEVYHSTHRLQERARGEARSTDWHKRLEETFPDSDSGPHVYVAPIASGNQVVAATDSPVLELLRSYYGDALAVEMEGYGFLDAAHFYPQIDALIIRGISDRIADKGQVDAAHFQEVAARRASAFAFEVLAKFDLPGQQGGAQERGPVLPNEGPSPEVIAEDLLLGFRIMLPQYTLKIGRILGFLDEGRGLSPERCKQIITWLDTLDGHVQRLRRDAPMLQVLDFERVMLVNFHDQITALKSELRTFRRPGWFIKRPRPRRGDDAAYERIRAHCEALLADLNQFIREPEH
ncbi:MAG: 5'-methylthioadenosine/S-adenosylhomocysteine nucleosidase [Ktedonobacteraceae bacterium]|nr:5'-methylthioadenosine/S-adenosylhomocysteine nucleosidase [Ktedonobacteraceae bacterium]